MSTAQIHRIALCSFDAKSHTKAENLALCADWIHKAHAFGAEIILFPEMTLTGFEMQEASQCRLNEYDSICQTLAHLALQNHIAIGFGLVYPNSSQKPLNQFMMWNAQGETIAHYEKVHPFSLGSEGEHFSSGTQATQANLGFAQVGLSICYDLRFPEIYRPHIAHNALLFNIACWPKRRSAHWKLLCAARALENRCFFVGVNRTGVDSIGLEYEDISGVWNPDGIPLSPVISEEILHIYEIDLIQVRKARLALPSVKDRKSELYKTW